MKIFTLRIRCEGPAFAGGLTEFNSVSTEVADILRGVAASIQNDQPLDAGSFTATLRDSNGDTCGELLFTREEMSQTT